MGNMRWKCRPSTVTKCYLRDAMPDWEIFNQCFPRGIRVTDLDGFVEIGGWFLVLEWKKGNPNIPAGQMMSFRRLAQTGKFSVIIMYGDPITDVEMFTRKGHQKKAPSCSLDVVALVSKWVQFAESVHA